LREFRYEHFVVIVTQKNEHKDHQSQLNVDKLLFVKMHYMFWLRKPSSDASFIKILIEKNYVYMY
jgi:hypothetical protein